MIELIESIVEKEELFKLISKEEVVLFAGAGMSTSAGLPTANNLRDLLIESLSVEEKKQVPLSESLPNLTEALIDIRDERESIIDEIESIFKRLITKESILHQNLAKISHFKNIITTNYDSLIEDHYKGACQVITKNIDLNSIVGQSTKIFKIHGDFNNRESLMLTHSDYTDFFTFNTEHSNLWTVIKEKFISNTILFIGYNLADSNIEVLFKKILKSVEGVSRKYYLVAPGLKFHNVRKLEKLNVKYINTTAEDFISELISYLNDNIVEDARNGLVTSDTMLSYFKNNSLSPTIVRNGNGIQIEKLTSVNDGINGRLEFSIPMSSGYYANFLKFANGELKNISIPNSEVESLMIRHEGIRFKPQSAFLGINAIRIPDDERTLDLYFPEEKIEFEGIISKLYILKDYTIISLCYKDCELEYTLTNISEFNFDFSLHVKHKTSFSSLNEKLQLYSFLRCISIGQEVRGFHQGKVLFSKELPQIEELLENSSFMIGYLSKLSIIEKEYNFKFGEIKFEEITESTIDLVNYIIEVVEGKWVEAKFSSELELCANRNLESFERYFDNEKQKTDTYLYQLAIDMPVSLHNKEILLGLNDTIVKDWELLSFTKKDKEYYIAIRSKSKRLMLRKLPHSTILE